MRFEFQDPEATDAMLAWWHRQYGLTPDQMIWNRWGLPFLPKPVSRKVHDRLVLFPDNAALGVVGHPMYWLQPSVTDPRPGEDMEMWNIRLFILLQRLSMLVETDGGVWNWVDALSYMGVDEVDEVMTFAHRTRETTPLPTTLLRPGDGFDHDAYEEHFASTDAYLRANGQRLINEWQQRRFAAMHQQQQAQMVQQQQAYAERSARTAQVAKGVGLGAAMLTLDLVGAVFGGGDRGSESSSYVSPAERKRQREDEQIRKAAVRRARRELHWSDRGLFE